MRILYALQGTGNGHVSRASEIIPKLQEFGNTDILISGTQSDILPFDVNYKLKGLSFVLGRSGKVSFLKTIQTADVFRLLKDVKEIDVEKYDFIINDFEPVSAWSCKKKRIKCIGLSHQNAVIHPIAPKPEKPDRIGDFVLRNYAPVNFKYGFHFEAFDKTVFTPVIRTAIREANVSVKEHYTVYLPAFSDQMLVKVLSKISGIKWEIFSKNTVSPYRINNLHFNPISVAGFTESFLSCKGILCSAGFETPAEAIYMGKKLCVVPQINQYEQQCNAAFLKTMGVNVINNLLKPSDALNEWISTNWTMQIHYPDSTYKILEHVLNTHHF